MHSTKKEVSVLDALDPADILDPKDFVTSANYTVKLMWERQREARARELEERITQLEKDIAELILLKGAIDE